MVSPICSGLLRSLVSDALTGVAVGVGTQWALVARTIGGTALSSDTLSTLCLSCSSNSSSCSNSRLCNTLVIAANSSDLLFNCSSIDGLLCLMDFDVYTLLQIALVNNFTSANVNSTDLYSLT